MAFVTSRDATPQTVGSTSWHLILTVHRTQAEANTEGNKADRTAYTGNITNLSVTPQDWWLDRTTGNVRLYTPEPAPSSLMTLAIQTVRHLVTIDEMADSLGATVSAANLASYHDVRRWGTQHVFLVLNDSTLTGSQRSAYLRSVAAGPSGLSLATPTRSAVGRLVIQSGNITAPTQPSMWVDPNNGNRLAFSSMNSRSGTIPSNVYLEGTAWVEALPI